ncbi:superinfection exclusion protein [Pelagibacter phage Hroenn EXVC015P]|nr:superinfection exclusion protein [Pelagibacter phage Bylgja EXVC010P]QLF88327.1 superinfection exclusion protein [Pelagibacter phage Himinglaeva EXVC011P]QLF88378.1 superinfection exclusion protein [Pelagibacter phage Hroenn EXVC015P]QLF88575.1 superinfection exclusion protein [Pelagibacter phage Unn EXVC019P]
MAKVMDALGDMFTEDIFQLLLDRKYKAAKAMMKTLGMKKVHIDKMIADSKKITTLH